MELLDLGNHPIVYVDDVADIQFLGTNARLVLFTWQRINGILQRVVALEEIRPIASVKPAILKQWQRMFPTTIH